MRDAIERSPSTLPARVRLEGGPAQLSGTLVLADLEEVIVSPDKVKIRHHNGYEHFEAAAPLGSDAYRPDAPPALFQWTGRTKIAE